MYAYIETLGCKVNTYESEFMSHLLTKENYIITKEITKANVIILNTCTVTNKSDTKCRKTIRSLRRKNAKAILIVVGCYIQNLNEDQINLLDADIILGTINKSKIIFYINQFQKEQKKIIKIYNVNDYPFEDMEISKFESKTRAFIKIQDGCNNFCSYCIIPYVRGRLKSKDEETVLKEINSLVNNQTKEIVLTGIHTGLYNSKDTDLYLLIKNILKNTKIFRLRLSSIEIVELNDKILDLFENKKVLANQFHIPLQSGCDKILKLMNRRYDTAYFKQKVGYIRNKRKDVSLTTDVIVGFPNESEEDFLITYNFCKEIGFSKIHVFPYSDREGTAASKMDNHVKESDKKTRVKKLLELSSELEKAYYDSQIGKEEYVIIEEVKDNFSIGHTSNFIKVFIKEKLIHNEIYKIKFLETKEQYIISKTIK